jgi:hypothetical protein
VECNAVEGKFGQEKRRFGLGRVMCKLATTAGTAVLVTFLVINLDRWLTAILLWFFYNLRIPSQIESLLSVGQNSAPKFEASFSGIPA